MAMDLVKELPLEQLLTHALDKEMLEKIEMVMEKAEETMAAMSDKQGEEKQTAIKAGTVLTLLLVTMMEQGIDPRKLGEEEWKVIAEKVSKEAVLKEDAQYSVWVFDTYAFYFNRVADNLEDVADEAKVAEIRRIAMELTALGDACRVNDIPEVEYIDQCLWLSLEGVVKVLTTMASTVLPKEAGDFVQAGAMLAFEYGRYKLYETEQALLQEYLDHQKQVDAELEQRYAEYLALLQSRAETFGVQLEYAFAERNRTNLETMAALARAEGVPEEELFHSEEEIDAFFM